MTVLRSVELTRSGREEWWQDRLRLADLADWLKEQAREPEDFAYYLRKPWKYTGEYEQMCQEEAQERYADERDADRRWAL